MTATALPPLTDEELADWTRQAAVSDGSLKDWPNEDVLRILSTLSSRDAALAVAADTTWFWEIVDRNGPNGLPSDERAALRRLVERAETAEALVEDHKTIVIQQSKDIADLELRAETAEAKVVAFETREHELTMSLALADLFGKEVDALNDRLAEKIATLERSQRTPGCIEVCEYCQAPAVEADRAADFVCNYPKCPIAALKPAGAP